MSWTNEFSEWHSRFSTDLKKGLGKWYIVDDELHTVQDAIDAAFEADLPPKQRSLADWNEGSVTETSAIKGWLSSSWGNGHRYFGMG